MNILRKQALLLCLFLLLFIGVLSADSDALLTSEDISGYAIASYEFKISGKTTQFALRSAIIPPGGDPVWETENAFLKALNAKRQTLINKQLFLSVEYEYSFTSFSDGIAYYTVTFFIEDSNTFIVLPYPKFDNDKTGFLFGIKAKDTNLLGTFGLLNLTVYTSQNDGTLESWDNRKDHLEFDITGVAVGGTNLSLNFLYERQKEDKPEGKIEYDIGWTGIRLMETKLAFSFDGVIDPSAPTQQFDYDISWTGLKLFGTKLNLKTWAEYDPSSRFEQMNPDIHGFSWAYGPFKQNEGRYTLNNLFEWNAKLTNVKTETNLIQHDLKLFTRPLSFKITLLTNKKVELENIQDATLSTTLGTNFKLPFIGWRWTTSFSPGVEYQYGRESLAQYLEYTNTISNGGRVNFLSSKDKFREGFIFNFKHVYRDYQGEDFEYKSYWYVESNITWFPFVIWRFNPHLRFNGFYSGLNPKKYYFLPSENKNVSEYYRGYLSRSNAITFENGTIPYGGVLNLNLMMEFIDFGFAKSYANPFLDIGIFGNPDAEEGYSLLATAGMEGWGVLDRFPSHPMRIALGFNLFDVMDAVKGTIDPLDVEWELSVSFELFF
jgi:hypothetical protein